MKVITIETIQLAISILTLGGFIVIGYRYFRDPDVKAEQDINQIKLTCKSKHEVIDKSIERNAKDLTLIKENHIAHIEKDIRDIQLDIIKILTILEEREKNK